MAMRSAPQQILRFLHADAVHWDLDALGRSVQPGSSQSSGVYYDVRDTTRQHPYEVLERNSPPKDLLPATWRISCPKLSIGPRTPIWLPTHVSLSKETRVPAGIEIFTEGLRPSGLVPLRAARAEITGALKRLQPGTEPLTVSWKDPIANVTLAASHEAQQAGSPRVAGLVLGPLVQVVLQRKSDLKLELLGIEGGPDGLREVAQALFQDLLSEIMRVKEAAEAAAAHAAENQREKAIIVFGKIYRPGKKVEQTWDAESESFALWSALQRWAGIVKAKPSLWRMQFVELDAEMPGGEAMSASLSVHAAMTPRYTHLEEITVTDDNVDKELLEVLHRAFDADNSGDIDWEEFCRCSKKLMGFVDPESSWTEDTARQEFEALDANGDGLIQQEEWLAYAGHFLSVLQSSDIHRVIVLLGQSLPAFSARNLAVVQGEVDVGLTCRRGHPIRPLRLNSWGRELASQLGLAESGGFRCAEIDDPVCFAAAQHHRCTNCDALDSKAVFSVSCADCGAGFPSGWWCSWCILKEGRPRNRHGHRVSPLRLRRQGPCKFCQEPAVVGWPEGNELEPLCNDHGADRLLQEAASCYAARGRDHPAGSCLLACLSFELSAEFNEDLHGQLSEDEIAMELTEALALQGVSPDLHQLRIPKIQQQPDDSALVHVEILSLFGKPSPYELFLRLCSLAIDRDGPIYSSNYPTLSKLRGVPEVTDIVVADESDQTEMIARLMNIVIETRSTSLSASYAVVLKIRPQRIFLPNAIVLSLRCLQPPEGARGYCVAHVLAFAAGAKSTMPEPREFEQAFFIEKPEEKGKSKPKKKKASVKIECMCRVGMSSGLSGDMEALEGEGAMLGLKPEREYDIFVAIFGGSLAADGSLDASQPVISMTKGTLRTCAESRLELFEADSQGVVSMQTEEPDVARRACLVDFFSLAEVPCIIDQHSGSVSCTPDDKSKKAAREHCVDVELRRPEDENIHPNSSAKGEILPSIVLVAKPSYTRASLSVEVKATVDAVAVACPEHCFSAALHLPVGLTARGTPTQTRCCHLLRNDERCEKCVWTKLKQKIKIPVKVDLDIFRMVEIEDWASVLKRADICDKIEMQHAVGAMLNKRPHLDTEIIMRVFNSAVGRHSTDANYVVRSDGATGLHVAVEEHHVDAVVALLHRQLDPNVKNSAGQTALHVAARGGTIDSPQVAMLLLDAVHGTWRGEDQLETRKAEAQRALLDSEDNQGWTALHCAAFQDHQALVACLLRAMANPRCFDKDGHSPLHVAASAGALRSVQALLLHDNTLLDLQTASPADPVTAMPLACQRCHAGVVDHLLSCKADASIQVAVKGRPRHMLSLLLVSAAEWAVFCDLDGIASTACQIIQQGQPPPAASAEAGAAFCRWALHLAIRDVNAMETAMQPLKLLQKNGLDLPTTLGRALIEEIKLSLSDGMVTDRRNDHRVAHALTEGLISPELPKLISRAVSYGASPDIKDANGETAMHLLLRYPTDHRVVPKDQATGECIAECVRELMRCKADVRQRNNKGEDIGSLVRNLANNGECYLKSWQDVLGEDQAGKDKRSERRARRAAAMQTQEVAPEPLIVTKVAKLPEQTQDLTPEALLVTKVPKLPELGRTISDVKPASSSPHRRGERQPTSARVPRVTLMPSEPRQPATHRGAQIEAPSGSPRAPHPLGLPMQDISFPIEQSQPPTSRKTPRLPKLI
eukprot:TRINITY_DN18255_c0_g2_i1.p1 TRINITY_DN18255_c0_g2~~TRINITY_DN18255_c0_g2_i1.p1  ORF type:complete len:1698 (-),score=262.36 TRINITY_DN18255_c0_g2_i1:60-5153(-)